MGKIIQFPTDENERNKILNKMNKQETAVEKNYNNNDNDISKQIYSQCSNEMVSLLKNYYNIELQGIVINMMTMFENKLIEKEEIMQVLGTIAYNTIIAGKAFEIDETELLENFSKFVENQM